MLDTIILLTGAVEQPVFTPVLRRYNPDLTVVPVFTADELARVAATVLRRARLIAFTTQVIVPPVVLDQLGYGAYNFHPGPPRYPGWAPAHFALYDRATEFGATLHAMVERVDAGPIVDAALFPVPADISVSGLEELAYTHLAQMFWRWAEWLATRAEALPERSIQWSGKRNSRRRLENICDIPVTVPKEELEHLVKVFGSNYGGIAPTINLHGIRFRAVPPDLDAA
jgi:methionyl-tRNA formyltransferase